MANAQLGFMRGRPLAALGVLAWTALVAGFGWLWWQRSFLEEQTFEVVGAEGGATLNGVPLVTGASGRLLDGAQLVTGPGALVNLRLQEGSFVQVAPDTRATIAEARVRGDGTQYRTVIKLDAGEIIRKLPKAGSDGIVRRAELITPSVNIGVRGTEFAASVDGDKARTVVHRGVVALDAAEGKTKEMTENYGTVVAQGLAAEPPSVLLPPPAPALPPPSALAEAGAAAFSWEPIAGAIGYLLEVAQDDAFDSIVARSRTDQPQAQLAALPHDAPFRWRVASIDGRGLRGRGSEPRTLHYKYHHAQLRARTAAGDSAGALALANAALKGYGTDAEVHGDIGWAHYTSGNFAAARAAYDRALVLAPEHAGVLLRRGRALYWLKDYPKARADYARALELLPGDADALWGLAEVALAENQPAEGIGLLEKAIKAAPAHEYARLTLARAVAATDLPRARKLVDEHLALHPGDAAALEFKATLK